MQLASLDWNYNCVVIARFVWAFFAEIYATLGFIMINYEVLILFIIGFTSVGYRERRLIAGYQIVRSRLIQGREV